MSRITNEMLIAMINAYYEKDGNSAGGRLHIVLDDLNLESDHIEFCIGQAREAGDWDGVLIGQQLLLLSEAELNQLMRVERWGMAL